MMKEISNTRLIFGAKSALAAAMTRTSSTIWQLLSAKLDQCTRQSSAIKPLAALWKKLVGKLAAAQRRPQVNLRELGEHQFIAGSYANFSGSLKYHLFIPKNFHAGMPLLVMLHGCSQDAEIFATGTRMNLHAEQLGFVVLYPAQSGLSNMNKCWNWYQSINQHRDRGEPAVIAGMTQEMMATYQIDPHKVYIAGMSAGAAMAYIVGSVYPDMYAAIGVHSGLLYRGINNMFSALAAMKTGSGQIAKIEELRNDSPATTSQPTDESRHAQPLIIFHGDQDVVVDPQNALDLMAYHHQDNLLQEQQYEETSAHYDHTRTTYHNEQGSNLAEQWIIHGAGHAWSGGDTEGSFTDANGPDASLEMMRFFMASAQPTRSLAPA